MVSSRQLPPEYDGRSQTFFKHRAYEDYVFEWAVRVGSAGRPGSVARLWVSEPFAGAWGSRTADMSDTSVGRGLGRLLEAHEALARIGRSVEINAVFVEDDRDRFDALEEFCQRSSGVVRCHPVKGTFHANLPSIDKVIGRDPALVFVDPWGWKDCSLEDVARVARGWRDVLIRVPQQVYRFSRGDVERHRDRLEAFFGVPERELPFFSREDRAIEFYCAQLRDRGLKSAWMVIPEIESLRTPAWMVVAGRHDAVVEVFRTVENQVAGVEAGELQAALEPQGELFGPSRHRKYEDTRLWREADLVDAIRQVLGEGTRTFRELCGEVLQVHHLTSEELGRFVIDLNKKAVIDILDFGSRRRKIRHDDSLRMRQARRVDSASSFSGSAGSAGA